MKKFASIFVHKLSMNFNAAIRKQVYEETGEKKRKKEKVMKTRVRECVAYLYHSNTIICPRTILPTNFCME